MIFIDFYKTLIKISSKNDPKRSKTVQNDPKWISIQHYVHIAPQTFVFTVINMFKEISVGAVFLSGTWYVFSGTWYVFSGTWYDYRTYYIGVLMPGAVTI